MTTIKAQGHGHLWAGAAQAPAPRVAGGQSAFPAGPPEAPAATPSWLPSPASSPTATVTRTPGPQSSPYYLQTHVSSSHYCRAGLGLRHALDGEPPRDQVATQSPDQLWVRQDRFWSQTPQIR